jgi:cobyrinic acid a,c-diamide synthase
VVAGTHSGVGKTSLTLGLLAALRRRGVTVAPFKAGPDYLDPAHHRAAAGRPSHNLDGWMLSREANVELFRRSTADAEVAVIEGVMGLYDGRDGATETGSTAELAKWLDAEVVLVVDCFAMARSAAAVIRGFVEFDPDLRFAGVVLNRVAGERHFEWLRQAIEPALDVPILGWLPHREDIAIPERHLGLVQAEELDLGEHLERLADWVETGLDLEALLADGNAADASSGGTPPWPSATSGSAGRAGAPQVGLHPRRTPRVGIARDLAFSFYYEANLDLLRETGAELVPFSPLRDEVPEDVDALWFGGGYPELFSEPLGAAARLGDHLRRWAAAGLPILAECGGLMYLGRSLRVDGVDFPMASVLPLELAMTPRLSLGYCEVRSLPDNPLGSGVIARGHRFHRSEVLAGPRPNAWVDAEGERRGYARDGVLASYVHLHFMSNPGIVQRWLGAARAPSSTPSRA